MTTSKMSPNAAARFAAFPVKVRSNLAQTVAAAMAFDFDVRHFNVGTPAHVSLEELCYALDAGDGFQGHGNARRWVYEFEDGSGIVLSKHGQHWDLRDSECEIACAEGFCSCNAEEDEDEGYVSTEQQRLMDEDDDRSAFNDRLESFRDEF
jgi:hypothetical protein